MRHLLLKVGHLPFYLEMQNQLLSSVINYRLVSLKKVTIRNCLLMEALTGYYFKWLQMLFQLMKHHEYVKLDFFLAVPY